MHYQDLHNPMWVFKEMTRISRIGYVETPSPSGELVHHNDLPYLGSIHHRFFLWTNPDDNSLNILPKYAILEYLTQQPLFQSMYTRATSILKSNMVLWNNYYLWSDFDPSHQAKFHLHQHEIGGYDLRNTESYLRLIYEGMEKSQTSTSNFILGAQIELQESPEYDEEMK